MTTTLVKQYHFLIDEMSDPRVQKWPFMSGPGPVLGIIIFYLLAVKKILPKYMENRKPFNLRTLILYYNLFQIGACVVLIYGIATSGWTTHYTLGCELIDYSENPMSLRMLNFVYYTFILKMIELIETIFFVLRKKYNQVSNLHIYHHSSTLLVGWLGTKYIGGGMFTFHILLNTFIHVLMYSYYLLASLGPDWQKKLAKWKPRLTMLQMVQFCILLAHAFQVFKDDCKAPRGIMYFYIPNVFMIFYMFWNFYKGSYIEQKKIT